MSKRVLLAAPRGYCAGVDRAVVAVEKSLELYGAPVYVRKEIVHNKHVVSTLEQRGVIFVNETDEVPEGATVVFSAHGVSPAVHAEAAARNLKTIDATCPLVTKVHNEVKRFANEETEILLIGHNGHEEVEGTAGEAPGKVRVVDGLDEARTIEPTPGKKLVWLTQTTLSVDETMQSVAILKDRFPEIANPPSDDICYATQNRQEAIKAIAPQADLVLVVGSTNSSNSVRLVEVALEYGAKNAYLIDYAAEVKEEWLANAETIGVTSGASVPEILVDDLLKHLSTQGFADVEEVRATEETLLFALPKELRADLKAAK
ncbi:lytB 4-Hydroxy-3-methylbut-2-enyl diphosphate reductase IspH [Candidatus Nanopelagicaceae bacterium]